MQMLSVVVPTYNEAAAIRAGKLDTLARWLGAQPYETELLVVDDGSQDETAAAAAGIADRVIKIAHAGKAAAIVAGLQEAAGEVILFTDMDQATPISELPKLLSALEAGADIAAGSRGLVRPGAPPGRYLLSWGQAILKRLLLGLRITDTQCGFKAFRRSAVADVLEHLVIYDPDRLGAIDSPSVTSGFDVELLFVARRRGYLIAEVPVTWNYQETRRVSLLRDAWRGLLDLFKIAALALRGRYPRAPARKRALKQKRERTL